MARPSLKAQYFVAPDGIVTIKAPALKPKERRFIYDRDGGECQRCARPVMFGGITASPFQSLRSGQVDHIFPRSRGGQNGHMNLQLLCLTCNSSKGTD